MSKTKINQNIVQSGIERIEEIKSEIQSCNRETNLCKVEVYDMWSEISEDEEEE